MSDVNSVTSIRDFTDLIVWQKVHQLCISIYVITKSYPKDEVFGLTSQIRRSASSVTANIAEGFSRRSVKDQLHFYNQSKGSLMETRNHLFLSRDVGYLGKSQWIELDLKATEVLKLLNGLIKAHTQKLPI